MAADTRKVSLADAANHALGQSQITLPGSLRFHLKATITETTNPDSGYQGTVKEYWASPDKWWRTVTSPHFTETVIHNGDRGFESHTGDYYPLWLRNLVTAMFDPLPMIQLLKPMNVQVALLNGKANSSSCARLQMKVGVPPAQDSVFLVFCFNGDKGLIKSITTPAYSVEFKNYVAFKSKLVASVMSRKFFA